MGISTVVMQPGNPAVSSHTDKRTVSPSLSTDTYVWRFMSIKLASYVMSISISFNALTMTKSFFVVSVFFLLTVGWGYRRRVPRR